MRLLLTLVFLLIGLVSCGTRNSIPELQGKDPLFNKPEQNSSEQDSNQTSTCPTQNNLFNWQDYKQDAVSSIVLPASISSAIDICFSGNKGEYIALVGDQQDDLVVVLYNSNKKTFDIITEIDSKKYLAGKSYSFLQCLDQGDFLLGVNTKDNKGHVFHYDRKLKIFFEIVNLNLGLDNWQNKGIWGKYYNDFWLVYTKDSSKNKYLIKHVCSNEEQGSGLLVFNDYPIVKKIWGLNNYVYVVVSKGDTSEELIRFNTETQKYINIELHLERPKEQLINFITGTNACDLKIGGNNLFGQKQEDEWRTYQSFNEELLDGVSLDQNFIAITTNSFFKSNQSGLVSINKPISNISGFVSIDFKKNHFLLLGKGINERVYIKHFLKKKLT